MDDNMATRCHKDVIGFAFFCGCGHCKASKSMKLGYGFIVLLGLLMAEARGADEPKGAESQFLGNVRPLTFEGRRSGEGYFSPDGKSLIFQSEREPGNPFYQIYILDLEIGEASRVSPGIGKTTCAFFRPGSDEVLFASTHLDPDAVAKQKAE